MNYIVSGLERSGTSLMMQMLEKGNFPVSYNTNRKADEGNPHGYYELFDGKIIHKLMKGELDFNEYDEKAIKITAYGLKFLPRGSYKIIFMTRNMKEIAMSNKVLIESKTLDIDKVIKSNTKLLNFIVDIIDNRKDIDVIYVNYNDIINNPMKEAKRISEFLGDLDVAGAVTAVDSKLYRNREEEIQSATSVSAFEMTEDEEKRIKERLKKLGYL